MTMLVLACGGVVACGGGDRGSGEGHDTTPALTAIAMPLSQPTVSPLFSNACSQYQTNEGQPWRAGPAFASGDDTWVLCLGGVASSNQEKLLLHEYDGGESWQPISEYNMGFSPVIGVPGGLPTARAT